MRRLGRVALTLVSAGVLIAPAAPPHEPPVAEPNPNLQPAGTLATGVLMVTLEIGMARWYPDEDGGVGLLVPVFAEEGRAPQVPAPLLRMPEGTDVQVTLRNTLATKVTVFGLHTRPADEPEGVVLEPGATRALRFRAGPAGTYHYYAIADPEVQKLGDRWYHDGALSGAFIVDRAGAPPNTDRVWVLNILSLRANPLMDEHELLTINGKAWPYTERVTAREGQPVHWRIVNSTPSEHPMHLHGAYFKVLGTGNAERYTNDAEEDRRTVVTEYMLPGATYEMEWVPLAPGGWLFHCHYVLHMVPELALPRVVKAAGHEHGQHTGESSAKLASHGMGGLVLAVNVEPNPAATPPPVRPRARQLDLIVEPDATADAAVVTTLREPDSGRSASASPGPLLLLARGEPVDITVSNRLKEPTSIHWHGIELDSYFDGVPGIGSMSRQVTPAIPPGESFVARMTPPRSGTFIYHTHWGHDKQLTGGLYGPLVVLEPGEAFDTERQKVLVVGTGELSWITGHVLLNGMRRAPPMTLTRGETYRLRLINIAPNQDITVTLGSAEGELEWRMVAKDGFELPSRQRVSGPARLVFSVGETYDFEFTPVTAGDFRLLVRSNFNRKPESEAVADVYVRDPR